MAIGGTMKNTIVDWGVLAIVIVVMSVVLLKFKDVSGVTAGLNTTIDSFVTGLSEPANWIIIVVVGLIGFALVKMFNRK